MLLQEVPKGASTALGHPGVGSWAPSVLESSSEEGEGAECFEGGGRRQKGWRFRWSFVKDFHFLLSLICSSFLFIYPFLTQLLFLNFAFSSFLLVCHLTFGVNQCKTITKLAEKKLYIETKGSG